jgi:hypothetical protein
MQKSLKYQIRDTFYKPLYKFRYRCISKNSGLTSQPLTSPVIITGIYRSGTTLCSSIIENIGVDLGPEAHKCGGIGNFRKLNSEGFQENFLVNDLGRYILYVNGGTGINFPDANILSSFSLEKIDDSDFAYYSEIFINDDRVDTRSFVGNRCRDVRKIVVIHIRWNPRDIGNQRFSQVYVS